MKFIYKYLNCKTSVSEAAKALNQSVQEVDAFTSTGLKAKGVVTARIVDIQKHPNANKLKIITIDCGDKVVDLVTGAPNVEIGQIIAYAPPSAKILRIDRHGPNFNIDEAQLTSIGTVNLRGIESPGMVCGADELGVVENISSEIYLFPRGTDIGKPAENIIKSLEFIETDDKGTAHRPDLLCYKGIETELNAINRFHGTWTMSKGDIAVKSKTFDAVVSNHELASVFCVAHISGIKNIETPDNIKEFLIDNNIKIVNFPTDITNYIMLMEGVPTHVFDYSSIEKNKLLVRLARNGETINVLNNKSYKLCDEDIVIADASKPLDMAGIIGGISSATSHNSDDIILSAAAWNPMFVRRTSRKYNIRTDSLIRFERGLENNFVINGFHKTLELMVKYGRCEIKHLEIIGNSTKDDVIIKIDAENVNRLSGINIPNDEIYKYLHLLGYTINNTGVIKPWWRKDIHSSEDVIEDVVRLYGYDNIPLNIPSLVENNAQSNYSHQFMYNLETYSSALFYQVKSSAMIKGGDAKSVEISNPIGDKKFMRSNLFESAEGMATNFIHRGKEDFGLFEISKVHTLNDKSVKEKLEVIFSISDKIESAKSKIGTVLHKLKIDVSSIAFSNSNEKGSIFHYNKIIGELKQKQIRQQNVYFFSFDVKLLQQIALEHPLYQHYSSFPVVKRDIAFVIDNKYKLGDISKSLQNTSKYITLVTLFDKYTDSKIGNENQSLAFHLIFQSIKGTLTDSFINELMKNIEDMLKNEYKAQIREQ